MNENIKSSYYSILPAVVRYDKDLTDKAKLLYSEITCLCNKEGVGKIVNECHNQTENDRKRHFKVGSVKMFRIKNRIHKNILSKK